MTRDSQIYAAHFEFEGPHVFLVCTNCEDTISHIQDGQDYDRAKRAAESHSCQGKGA